MAKGIAMRLLTITAGLILVSAAVGLAQDIAPGRFAIEPSVDGFIRLDTETGAVSHCYRENDVWRCDVLAQDRSALADIADEVRALNEKLDALADRVDALEADRQAAAPPEAAPAAEPGFAEELVRRLFLLVRDIKRERQASS